MLCSTFAFSTLPHPPHPVPVPVPLPCPPLQRRSKLTEMQTAEMIKTAAQRPDEKARYIDQAVAEKVR